VPDLLQAIAALPKLVTLLGEKIEEMSKLIDKLGVPYNLDSNGRLSKDQRTPQMLLASKKLLTLKEAAFVLSMSVKSVRRQIKRGLLKACKGLRTIRIPVEEINRYLDRTV
jgi:excisionase family DNA binding protein